MTERVDTIVVGAGMAGLAYAQGRGPEAEVLVLEASERVGGLVSTRRGDDHHFETGPEALQDNAPELVALLDELGLAPAPADAAAKRRFIAGPDEQLLALPSGPGDLFGTKLLGLGGKLGLIRGVFRKVRNGAPMTGGASAPGKPGPLDGSIADFVRGHFGAQVLQRLVDPAVSGIWAGDPETLSLRAAIPALYDMLAEHGSLIAALRAKGKARRAEGKPRPPSPSLLSVEGGLDALPSAIGAALGERLITGAVAEQVAADGDGWRVEAGGRTHRARRCILALPAARAAAVLAQDQPALSQPLASVVSESVASVAHCWRRDDLAHALDGFGYLVPSCLGALHLGTLFSSSIQPGRAAPGTVILRTLIGGARRPELLERDDQALEQLVVDEVGPRLGAASGARPQWSHVTRWPAVLPRYDLEHPARQATIDAVLSERSGLAIVGNHRRGISVNALVTSSRELAREHAAGGAP